jgi:hypothetical protein
MLLLVMANWSRINLMKVFKRHYFSKISILLVVLIVFLVSPLWAKKAVIKNIVVTTSQKYLLVYFTVDNCFTKEMEKAILNGLPITFTYKIILEEKRAFFPDKTLASLTLYHTLKYDQLKNVFIITRQGKTNDHLTSKDLIWAKKIMAEVEVPVAALAKLKKGHKYILRLKAELSKVRLPFYLHYIFFFTSLWDFETDWYAVEFVY